MLYFIIIHFTSFHAAVVVVVVFLFQPARVVVVMEQRGAGDEDHAPTRRGPLPAPTSYRTSFFLLSVFFLLLAQVAKQKWW